MTAKTVSFLPEDRKYKNLSSIIDTNEYKSLKPYIDIVDIIFGDETCDNAQQIHTQLKQILSEYSNISPISYCIDSLIHYAIVRPKKRKVFASVLSLLLKELPEKSIFTISANRFNDPQKYDFINEILYSKGVISKDSKRKSTQAILEIYTNALELYLKDDNVEQFSQLLLENKDKIDNSNLKVKVNSPLIVADKTLEFQGVSQINFCAFYGSVKCFKFLKLNGAQLDEHTAKCCIAGGNKEIIQIAEESGISFDKCFKKSIQYHHLDISEFLLSKYKCEIFPLVDCIFLYDYRAFVFLLLNGADVNFGKKSPLYMLCKQDYINIEAMKLLIQYGANVNRDDTLYALCKCDNPKIEAIKLLVDSGADVNKGNPLYFLCTQKNIITDALKILIDKKADVNQGKFTPLYALCSQTNINLDAIKLLVENGADVNKSDFYTPLYFLCMHTDINKAAIAYLIEKGADVNKGYMSPLYALCSHSADVEALSIIIKAGAALNTEIKENKIIQRESIHYSYTPLYALCNNSRATIDALKLLIENGAEINKGDSEPFFALCRQQSPNFELIQYLIEKGADINNESYNNGNTYTPLYYLCSQIESQYDLIKLLLDRGADPNKAVNGNTPLFAVCSQEDVNLDLINLLLDKGADINAGNITPLYQLLSQENINEEAIKLLLARGADANLGTWNESPLYLLCSQKEIDLSIIKLLLDQGADLNKDEYTPLYALCSHTANTDAINLLIEKGANVNQTSKDNTSTQMKFVQYIYTPLYALCAQNVVNIEAIKLLIEKGADVNKESLAKQTAFTYSFSPLYALCSKENIDIEPIKLLINAGAKVDTKLKNLLKKSKHKELVELFQAASII